MPPILTPVNDEGDNADCAADVCSLTVYIEDPGITQVVDIWGHPATVGELLAQHELLLNRQNGRGLSWACPSTPVQWTIVFITWR